MGVQILTSLLFNIKLLDLALDKRIHAQVRQEIYQGTWHISQISFGLNHGDVQRTDYCAKTKIMRIICFLPTRLLWRCLTSDFHPAIMR